MVMVMTASNTSLFRLMLSVVETRDEVEVEQQLTHSRLHALNFRLKCTVLFKTKPSARSRIDASNHTSDRRVSPPPPSLNLRPSASKMSNQNIDEEVEEIEDAESKSMEEIGGHL
ncbi:hypothetical protein E3N88_02787 [Mikania micrantha]|uniref:Uncharacterized protein n=1 Tax=Mikania micrantha TaxID=192012 RepID=A0A5N6Q6T8_9ASTR|nr:hypothetical protein E3N88_02787 [Mikania micrantha]